MPDDNPAAVWYSESPRMIGGFFCVAADRGTTGPGGRDRHSG